MQVWFLTIDSPWSLLILFGAALIDLGIRWSAFGRVESVAIDVAIFSWLYSFLKQWENDGSGQIWEGRVTWGLIILGVLFLLHTWLHRELLQRRIEQTFDLLVKRNPNSSNHETIRHLQKIASYVIDVSLVKQKQGKRDRRNEVVQLIRASGLDPNNDIDESHFILSKSWRVVMLATFAVLGAISIIIPVASIAI